MNPKNPICTTTENDAMWMDMDTRTRRLSRRKNFSVLI